MQGLGPGRRGAANHQGESCREARRCSSRAQLAILHPDNRMWRSYCAYSTCTVYTVLYQAHSTCTVHAVLFCALQTVKRVQFSSVAQLFLTPCDPMNHGIPGLPVHHQLPQFTQIHLHRVGDAMQPPHPLSSPSPPALNLS